MEKNYIYELQSMKCVCDMYSAGFAENLRTSHRKTAEDHKISLGTNRAQFIKIAWGGRALEKSSPNRELGADDDRDEK